MQERGSTGGTGAQVREHVPGIVLLGCLAVLARAVAPIVPGLNPLLAAVAAGVVWVNTVGVPAWARPGVDSHDVLLGAAIVLMGATLSVGHIVESGTVVLLTVAGVTTFTLAYVEVLSRNVFGITDKLGSLLAAGSGICGVSAVVAVGGSIRAREEHVVYAATTILLFDAVTLLVYPAAGGVLGLPDRIFGIWAGASMFSTGPVVAVGFAYSEAAGQWATITKLARNTLIGVVAVGYAAYYSRERLDEGGNAADDGRVRWSELWNRFPKFVVGFIAVMLIASIAPLTSAQAQSIEHAYNWLFMLAFVGLGANLRIGEFRQAGVRPVVVVFTALCTVSVLSLAALVLVLA